MSAGTIEVLDLVGRWIHVIAGIMWIGNSLLFNWLDRSLVTASAPGQTRKPVGTIWLLHSGGFYYVEKTLLEGEKLPAPLHWFMWQAITTWISGTFLLIVVYYAGGRATLEDPSVAGISHGWAIVIGVASIIGGRTIYDIMQRAPARMQKLATALWITALAAIAIALTQLLSGRAAFLHTGAMLATIMAGNLTGTIVPSQRALVKSVEGGATDAAMSARAKRVSIHNNYFTFPVIALMVSNHFSSVYGSRYSWLLLLVIVAGGATVRHILNIRWTFRSWQPALGATIALTILALWLLVNLGTRTVSASAQTVSGPVTFEDARHVIDRRCAVCHSERPTDLTFGPAPAGVMFDSRAQIEAKADRIRERAFVTRTMPPSNKTGITDSERAILGAWAGQR
ncbi:MAG TPA: urate hydroxylase PuuD [Gemmatimonadaceae bacterium]|nr:urate hydroxylase PuuD [Gemmatimonadaceae bacterium]